MKESTGILDMNGTEIFVGDDVLWACGFGPSDDPRAARNMYGSVDHYRAARIRSEYRHKGNVSTTSYFMGHITNSFGPQDTIVVHGLDEQYIDVYIEEQPTAYFGRQWLIFDIDGNLCTLKPEPIDIPASWLFGEDEAPTSAAELPTPAQARKPRGMIDRVVLSKDFIPQTPTE